MRVAMEDRPRRHRITVDEYHRMAAEGQLAPDARVELIEGEIVDMPPTGRLHSAAVSQLAELLHDALKKRANVFCQSSIRLGDFSEPEPDFVLLVRREDHYRDRYPTSDEVLLAIEVSDTSLRYDLQTKAALYARHGIRELWVIDLNGAKLHVFGSPVGETYTEAERQDTPSVVTLSAMPDVSIDLSGLFK